MLDDNQNIIKYTQALLYDSKIPEEMPKEFLEIEGMADIDHTLRKLRRVIKTIGVGDLSEKIQGEGYTFGVLKNLQSILKNLTWQTKAISFGDFSQRIDFLGEFSIAFNDMVAKLEAALLEVEETRDLFKMFFETIPDATLIISTESWTVLDCNRAFENMAGYTKEVLNGKSINEIQFFKDDTQKKVFFNSIGTNAKSNNILMELKFQNESLIYGLVSSDTIVIEREKHILIVIKDITEMKNLEQKLKDSEETHRLLADNANDVIWTMDLHGKFTYVSPSVEKLRGYSVEEVLAQSKEELLCPSSIPYLVDGLERAARLVEKGMPFLVFRGDMEQPCKDGTTIWTDLTVSGIYDKDNRFVGMLGVSRDITERLRMEEEIRKLSQTDPLTQISNRSKLDGVLRIEMERLSRSESVCTVILLDIDHFKNVNDTYGHLVGDEVLKEFAKIIRDDVRKIDTVGRWGGEEFMVIMPLSDVEGGRILAEKLRNKISEFEFTGAGKLTASFGVAQTRGELNAVEVVAIADACMYEAKNAGRNCVRICHN